MSRIFATILGLVVYLVFFVVAKVRCFPSESLIVSLLNFILGLCIYLVLFTAVCMLYGIRKIEKVKKR